MGDPQVWGGSSLSCGEQPGKLVGDAQVSDQLLTLQQSIHSPLLFMFHDVLGLHGVVLHALHLGRETRAVAKLKLG